VATVGVKGLIRRLDKLAMSVKHATVCDQQMSLSDL